MKRNRLFLYLVLVVLAAFVGAQLVSAAAPPPDYRPETIGDRIRTANYGLNSGVLQLAGDFAQAEAEAMAAVADTTSCITDAKVFLALDDYNGYYFFDTFYLIAEGPLSQIWVQADMTFPEGRGLADPVVTCEQAAYLLGEFESNIYPTEVAFFGAPDYLDGSGSLLEAWGYVPPGYYADSEGRQVVLVENVRDEQFYTEYPSYIAGFYSGTLEAYFGRNTMTIDSYDWANRIGPDVARPFLYEGVFAHEYQHLLHDDYDSDEVNWVNEGLSDWAEGLTGYGIPDSHVSFFADHPENSLTSWSDQSGLEILADYGIAYLYQEYMYQNYGQAFIQGEFHNPGNGIAGVDATLAGLGASESYADTFHSFAVATYTKGAFTNPLLSDFQVNLGPAGNPNPEAFATPGAPPWGIDYIQFNGFESVKNFLFNGYPFNPMEWTSDGSVLYSGQGNLVDKFMIAEANLTGVTGATLNFDTSYVIEDLWDFGFVQVSTDGGYTWTSLANAYTTFDHDPSALPAAVANLPGLTGDSGGWINMSFDLSAYDGQQILVAFRYMTDWAFEAPGWWVDNVDIAGVFFSDGSSTDGFKGLNEVLGISNNYTVTLIGESVNASVPQYEVLTILSGGYVSDWASISALFDNNSAVIMLVTYDADQGVSAYANYDYEISNFKPDNPVK